MSMRVSDIINNVTKHNKNVMASTLSPLERQKQKSFSESNKFWNQNVPYILTKKMHTNSW